MIKFIEKLFGICFHDWSKWEDVKVTSSNLKGETYWFWGQIRYCGKCNKKQKDY